MPKYSIRNGSETVIAEDREALARLVGDADAADAVEFDSETETDTDEVSDAEATESDAPAGDDVPGDDAGNGAEPASPTTDSGDAPTSESGSDG